MMHDDRSISQLSDRQRQGALKRYEIIVPFLRDERPLGDLAQEYKLTDRTLKRWVQQYREQGLAGLARKERSDKGQRRQIHPELQAIAEGLYLKQGHLSYQAIYRRIKRIAQDKNWEIPTYAVIYNILKSIPAATVTLAQEGAKVYKQEYDLLYLRECQKPNEIWQADHTLLDIYILDTEGELRRPWLSIILDDYSRVIAGYYVSFQAPSAVLTALALHQAIWRKMDSKWQICGIPDSFYTDHGSDFISEYMRQVGANLKMQLIFSEKGKPRGRGKIERFFLTVNQMFLMDLAGYAPKGKPVSSPTLSLTDFEQLLHNFLVHTYNYREHGTTKMPPNERWLSSNFIPRMPEKRSELDLLLLTVATTRRVRREGIRFMNHFYNNVNLSAFIHEEIVIRYDPRDMAEISVFYQDRFVCRAICDELSGQKLSLDEIRQARKQQHRSVRSEIQKRDKKIETYLALQTGEISSKEVNEHSNPSSKKLKRYHNE